MQNSHEVIMPHAANLQYQVLTDPMSGHQSRFVVFIMVHLSSFASCASDTNENSLGCFWRRGGTSSGLKTRALARGGAASQSCCSGRHGRVGLSPTGSHLHKKGLDSCMSH